MQNQNPPAPRMHWFKLLLILLFPWAVILLFPWAVFVVVTFGSAFGLDERFLTALPKGLISRDRAVIGVIALIVGCSSYWAYYRKREQGFSGAGLLAMTVLTALVLTSFQIWMLLFLLGYLSEASASHPVKLGFHFESGMALS